MRSIVYARHYVQRNIRYYHQALDMIIIKHFMKQSLSYNNGILAILAPKNTNNFTDLIHKLLLLSRTFIHPRLPVLSIFRLALGDLAKVVCKIKILSSKIPPTFGGPKSRPPFRGIGSFGHEVCNGGGGTQVVVS